MRADPFVQLRLLDLQQLDSVLARTAARRRALPAFAVIATVESELAGLRDRLVTYETQATDHGRAAAKQETDIEQVRGRAQRDQQRLDAGTVSNAKELESLQSEIASLARRQATLEDAELEVLEQREQAEREAAAARTAIDEAQRRLAAAQEERDRDLAALDAETVEVTGRRAELAPTLPAELLALYDRIRADRGGVGAAALLRRRCEGCHLELAGNDLTGVRQAPPDEVLRHDDCGRILIRTAESGL